MSSINFGKIYLKLIQFKFEELSNYQMEVEAFMNAKKKNSVNEYDKIEWSNIQDEEYKSFLNDTLSEEYHNYDKYYPNLLRSAIIFQTYSVMEKYFIQFCEFIHHHKKLSRTLKQVKVNGNLNKAITYLTEEFSINKNDLSPELEYIYNIRLLRNKITHDNGEIIISNNSSDPMNILINFILSEDSISTIKNYDQFKNRVPGEYTIYIAHNEMNSKFIKSIEKLFEKISQKIF